MTDRLISRPAAVLEEGGPHTLFSRGQLTIRVAGFNEAPAIVALTSTVFKGRAVFSLASFDNTTDVEQLMGRGKFLLAENDTGVIGFAYLEPRPEATRLVLLAVSPSRQRSGIGSQLLDAAERLSSSMRCLFMHIQVMNLHWETIKFCRRRGYVEFGIEPLNSQQQVSPYCHIVRMCKQLDTDRLAF